MSEILEHPVETLAPIAAHLGAFALASPIEEPRPCPDCGGKATFVEVYRSEFGRIGYCKGCEVPLLVQFDRTNG